MTKAHEAVVEPESILGEELKQANVNLKVEITEINNAQKEIFSWKVTSVVPLNINPDETLKVYCGNKLVLSGVMGKKNNPIAVQVEENFLKNHDDIQST